MKAKLFAFLALFFALTLAAWSYTPVAAVEPGEEAATAEWPEFPGCAGRDKGDAASAAATSSGNVLNQRENPVESAFVELSCLLASN